MDAGSMLGNHLFSCATTKFPAGYNSKYEYWDRFEVNATAAPPVDGEALNNARRSMFPPSAMSQRSMPIGPSYVLYAANTCKGRKHNPIAEVQQE